MLPGKGAELETAAIFSSSAYETAVLFLSCLSLVAPSPSLPAATDGRVHLCPRGARSELSKIAAGGGESGEWPKERSVLQSENYGYVIRAPLSRGLENIVRQEEIFVWPYLGLWVVNFLKAISAGRTKSA